uniref:ShKT domain-containing protein n=1 Tax=Romanomermis culicivorax TaxID=13658 RepID=A0A915L055_ROMCU
MCKFKNHRIEVSCTRRDKHKKCSLAAKDTNLCVTEPGFYMINCPVTCSNCERHCYDNPYGKEVCENAAKNINHGYKCSTKEKHVCPVTCGIC